MFIYFFKSAPLLLPGFCPVYGQIAVSVTVKSQLMVNSHNKLLFVSYNLVDISGYLEYFLENTYQFLYYFLQNSY